MRYSILGRTGMRVSQIALGTMMFGASRVPAETRLGWQEVFAVYRDLGGNFIDTANYYSNGESERLIGELVADDREHFVIATKYANAWSGQTDPNAAGPHRKSLMRSLDSSLQRLGVDYIDLYYVHSWDFSTAIEEVLRALEDAIAAGKILHVGLSDVPAWVVSRGQAFSDLRGLPPIAAMQLEYSLAERSIEREHIALARTHEIAVTAWSPLAGGILSGKYTGGKQEIGARRLDSFALQPLDERNRKIAEAVDMIARDLERPPSHVALAWLLQTGIIPVVGATRAEQMRENIAALDCTLDHAQVAALDAASAIAMGHPYNMVERDMILDTTFGGMFDQINVPKFPWPVSRGGSKGSD